MIMRTTYFRVISVILTLLLIAVPHHLKSQGNCSSTLQRAETLFDQGIIEEIPSLLAGCIMDGFTGEERKRAQKLTILAYIFDNKISLAENTMISFLQDNPEYEVQPDDPSEFVSLLRNFRTFPYLSIGILMGGNLTSATMLATYGPFNPGFDENYFEIMPEIQAGAAVSIFLVESLELNIEGIYTRNSFAHNIQYPFAEVRKKETHQRIELPVSLSYDLPMGRTTPYIRIGAFYSHLLSARASYSVSNPETGPDIIDKSDNQNILDRRNSGMVKGILGAGIKYKIPAGQIFFDLRYSHGFTEPVNAGNRWDQETTFRYYHTDGDFQLDNLSFSIGYRYLFYRTKKR